MSLGVWSRLVVFRRRSIGRRLVPIRRLLGVGLALAVADSAILGIERLA